MLLAVWRADAPSTRRTPNSTLYLPLAIQWIYFVLCLFFWNNVHTYQCIFTSVLEWPGIGPAGGQWAATALPLLVGGRGNNPSVPRLRLQPSWHIIMQDFPVLRKVNISSIFGAFPQTMLSEEIVCQFLAKELCNLLVAPIFTHRCHNRPWYIVCFCYKFKIVLPSYLKALGSFGLRDDCVV